MNRYVTFEWWLLGAVAGGFAVAFAAAAGLDPTVAAATIACAGSPAAIVGNELRRRRDAEARDLAAELFPKTPTDRWAELYELAARDPDMHARVLEALRALHAAAGGWDHGD